MDCANAICYSTDHIGTSVAASAGVLTRIGAQKHDGRTRKGGRCRQDVGGGSSLLFDERGSHREPAIEGCHRSRSAHRSPAFPKHSRTSPAATAAQAARPAQDAPRGKHFAPRPDDASASQAGQSAATGAQAAQAVSNTPVSDSSQSQPQIELPTREQVSREREALARRSAWARALRSTLATLMVVAAVAVLVVTIFLPVLQISGTSMEPTLHDGDVVVLVKNASYGRGDLCGVAYENKYLIKRIIGLPGDTIDIASDGTVYVNGDRFDEPYVSEKGLGECDLTFPYQVPDGKYFVMGDHRSTSVDSRSSVIGPVAADQIVGRVLLRVWPLNSLALLA